jgi:hypothetical protein
MVPDEAGTGRGIELVLDEDGTGRGRELVLDERKGSTGSLQSIG